jgi:DNA-directed RNA polymerase specialized sigma subunit
MSKRDSKKMSKIPQDGKTKQMDIFRTLLSPDNDISTLSNLIDLWDQIPKYHTAVKLQAEWRKAGEVKIVSSQVELNNDVFDVTISPALLKGVGDEKKNADPYFPSETEEIIEGILRKFLLDQNLGIHLNQPQSTWVKFSIRMIRTELKRLGKSRSNAEIRKSLEILTKSILTVKRNGRRIHTGPILSNWIDKPNEALSADHEDALSAVEFSNMVSKALSALEFRQYDYLTTSKLKNQVARWLMRRISINFRNAGFHRLKPIGHKVKLTEIVSESLLLDHIKNSKDQRRKVRQAIQELIDREVLILRVNELGKPTENESVILAPDGHTVEDLVFTLYASRDFVSKMTAANARKKLQKD